jgi:hypothetical protein
MKTRVQYSRRREKGLATITMLALLSIVITYLSVNMRSIDHLHRELKVLEQEQIKRLNDRAAATNTRGRPASVQTTSP